MNFDFFLSFSNLLSCHHQYLLFSCQTFRRYGKSQTWKEMELSKIYLRYQKFEKFVDLLVKIVSVLICELPRAKWLMTIWFLWTGNESFSYRDYNDDELNLAMHCAHLAASWDHFYNFVATFIEQLNWYLFFVIPHRLHETKREEDKIWFSRDIYTKKGDFGWYCNIVEIWPHSHVSYFNAPTAVWRFLHWSPLHFKIFSAKLIDFLQLLLYFM